MTNKPAIVFLCQRIPYPPTKGEKITSFNMVRHLSRHHRVFVGTFIDDPDDRACVEEFRQMVADLYVGEVRKPWAFLTAAPRWLLGEPLTFAIFRSRGLARWIDNLARTEEPIAIVTHSSNISAYATDNFEQAGPNRPRRLLHFADVDSEKFVAYADRASGLRRWIMSIEARRVRHEEQRLTDRADLVALVSDEEAELLRGNLTHGKEKVVTLPNGVDTDLFNPELVHEAPFAGSGAALVFTGAMDYLPNIEAVTWFAEHVFPFIRAERPAAQFLIVGSKPTPPVLALSSIPGVIVTGRVPSVAAYLAHSQVAVAPLRIARGIQNKVLEAMAMAMPVVVSPGALTGISATAGKDVACAESPEQWRTECLRLLDDSDGARAMGRAARELVLTRYGWERQFALMDQYLGLASPNASASPSEVKTN